MRITGCGAKGVPAVAVEEGCVRIVRVLAAAGLTATLLEVAPDKEPVLKSMVMFSALLYERLVKVTTPLTAVRLVVPCRVAGAALGAPGDTAAFLLLPKIAKGASIRNTRRRPKEGAPGWGPGSRGLNCR